MSSEEPKPVEALLSTPDLADALASEQFRQFLDHFPLAVVVSKLTGTERIVYANLAFETLSGQKATDILGKSWAALHGAPMDADNPDLATAIIKTLDRVGTFKIGATADTAKIADVYSNVIDDESSKPVFRLVALVDMTARDRVEREAYELRIREKDTLLREIQHRVRNNLQMITALIRWEARNAGEGADVNFDRLAGRVESLQLLYTSLSPDAPTNEIDLGIYLSQVASAVMRAHATEGVRLDLKIDPYPVSLNVAMPTGLVVNELMTNALKYAFVDREGGTIALHCLANAAGYQVMIADDGNGLPEGTVWPEDSKLSGLIVQSLRQNAKAQLTVESKPGKGTHVTIAFTRAASKPEPVAGGAAPTGPAKP